jgi:hypothetical protein
MGFKSKLHDAKLHRKGGLVLSSVAIQSIPNDADTPLSGWTENVDTDAVYPSQSWGAPFFFGDGQQGLWQIIATVSFAANAVGYRRLAFVNAVGDIASGAITVPANPTAARRTDLSLAVVLDLVPSGISALGLAAQVRQNSGAALDVQGSPNSTFLSVVAYRLTRG